MHHPPPTTAPPTSMETLDEQTGLVQWEDGWSAPSVCLEASQELPCAPCSRWKRASWETCEDLAWLLTMQWNGGGRNSRKKRAAGTAHRWRIPPVLTVFFLFLNFFPDLQPGSNFWKRTWNIQDVPLRVCKLPFFSPPPSATFLLAFDCSFCVVGGHR